MNVALRPEHLNLISLCTGGAGLDLGVELAIGCARVVCMVEREAFAVTHLVSAMQQGLLAQAPIWSDARTFDGRAWRGAVDGIIGGIPCQPHSLAGKRLGEEDERDLWSDARRIIVQSGAWFVLIENVRGMLSSGGAERVWRDLHRLGFEVEGGLFTAAEVGASHERERIFILAVADAERHGRRQRVSDTGFQRWQSEPHKGCGRFLVDTESDGRREGWAEPELSERNRSASSISSAPVGHTDVVEFRQEPSARKFQKLQHQYGTGEKPLFAPGPSDSENWKAALERAPELEPAFRRVADGLAGRLDTARVDRLRLLGNGVVSLEAAYALRTLITRLAARGSAGAARLVRLMEIAA
ncbi:DNA cytosine methyltransferase [Sinorhizobium meliloti]|uniref:DNA cytosine methyltransferase n=1 Tax=Rhizobium meliloti TaxID=382 RepID=UPI00299E6E20